MVCIIHRMFESSCIFFAVAGTKYSDHPIFFPHDLFVLVFICPYVFSWKMFVKSDFFYYSHLKHSSDENKKGLHFFKLSKSMKID